MSKRYLKGLSLLFLAFAVSAAGQSTVPDLTELSLDQLSNIKITSFAKKQQKLSQVAGAVYVITQEQIARSGLTSVPELLRLAPGIDVERLNGSQWAVSARGFTGVFANKLLVLIDGRSIYTPTFSGVYWDLGMPMLEDIDRIEVIRGPGATIWGANAVLGVINIITKRAQDAKGSLVTAAAGTSERAFGGARFGGAFGETNYRVSFAGSDHAQLATANGAGAKDGWSSLQGGFRMDGASKSGRDSWMLEGNLFRGAETQTALNPSAAAQAFVTSLASFNTASGDITGEWRRRIGDNGTLRLQTYYDYSNRPQPQAERVATQTGNLEIQYDFIAAKRHNFSVGAGDRLIQDRLDADGAYVFPTHQLTYNNANVFAQDEIHFLEDKLIFTAGAKLEANHFGGFATEPSANLVWSLNKHQSLWTSVARAVRTPTLFEWTVAAPVAIIPGSNSTGGLPVFVTTLGSPTFKNEQVTDFEVGYRGDLSKKVSVDANLFYDHLTNLRAFRPVGSSLVLAQDPYISYLQVFTNGYHAVAKGGETSLNWQVFHDWKLSGSYTYNFLEDWPNANAPPGTQDGNGRLPARNKWKVQSYWNVSKSFQLDTFAYWSSQGDPTSAYALAFSIPAYCRLDVRFGYRINPHWQLSVAGQNLLQPRHLEGFPELLTDYSYVTRGAYLKSTWQF